MKDLRCWSTAIKKRWDADISLSVLPPGMAADSVAIKSLEAEVVTLRKKVNESTEMMAKLLQMNQDLMSVVQAQSDRMTDFEVLGGSPGVESKKRPREGEVVEVSSPSSIASIDSSSVTSPPVKKRKLNLNSLPQLKLDKLSGLEMVTFLPQYCKLNLRNRGFHGYSYGAGAASKRENVRKVIKFFGEVMHMFETGKHVPFNDKGFYRIVAKSLSPIPIPPEGETDEYLAARTVLWNELSRYAGEMQRLFCKVVMALEAEVLHQQASREAGSTPWKVKKVGKVTGKVSSLINRISHIKSDQSKMGVRVYLDGYNV